MKTRERPDIWLDWTECWVYECTCVHPGCTSLGYMGRAFVLSILCVVVLNGYQHASHCGVTSYCGVSMPCIVVSNG
jgi:hypothetical protein